MITLDLIDYIQSQIRKDISKEKIISKLSSAGWKSEDIDEAFRKLTPPEIKRPVTVASAVPANLPIASGGPDLYREIPEISKGEDVGILPSVPPKQAVQPKMTVEKPVFAKSFSEANPNLSALSYYIPLNNSLASKKTDEAGEDSLLSSEKINFGVIRPRIVEMPSAPSPASNPSLESSVTPLLPQKQEAKNEFLPPLQPKIMIQDNLISTRQEFATPQAPLMAPMPDRGAGVPAYKVEESKFVPPSAILHSYPQVLSQKETSGGTMTRRKLPILKISLIILIILVLLGGAYLLVSGKVHFSFIKKDPKEILSEMSNPFKDISSYKIEHTLSISMPTVSNITLGLVSGEVAASNDRDTILLTMKGAIERGTEINPSVKYDIEASGSLLENRLSSRIVVKDGSSSVGVPDLSQFFGKLAPSPKEVLLSSPDTNMLGQIIPEAIQDIITRIDISRAKTIMVPSLREDNAPAILKEFLASASVSEKGEEAVTGIPTYHYSIIFDQESSKKLIETVGHSLVRDLSSSDLFTFNQVLGTVTMSPLDIWIGKDDGAIHQYAFTLTEPLSKILSLEDKGIAGNIVSLDWKTTYYDFGVPNNITLPSVSTTVQTLIAEVHDLKVKSLVEEFQILTRTFRNAAGNFGAKGNTGSCANPSDRSIFSPIGHPKGAGTAVGGIADMLSALVRETGDTAVCHSTSTAWAVSVPRIQGGYICTDSTGPLVVLTEPITGPQCK